jgi:hypothetical protein
MKERMKKETEEERKKEKNKHHEAPERHQVLIQ